MKKPSILPNLRKFINDPGGEKPLSDDKLSNTEHSAEQHSAHNGHTLPDCVPDSHECYIADIRYRIDQLEKLQQAAKIEQSNKKRLREEAESRGAKRIGHTIMNLRPKRSSSTKRMKN